MNSGGDMKQKLGHKVFNFLTRNTRKNSCCNTLCKYLQKAIVKKGIIVKYTNNNTYSGTK